MKPIVAARALPAILLIGYLLRALLIPIESLWRDEIDVVRFSLEPMDRVLARFAEFEFNGPLYHLMMRGWFALAGVSDFSLRYASLLFGVALIALVYATACRVIGRNAAWIAALLSAASPVLIWYGAEGKMYALQPALLTFALYALLRALSASGRAYGWWTAFAAAALLSFAVHVLSPLVLAVAALIILIHDRATLRRHRAPLVVVAGSFLLPIAYVLLTRFERLWNGIDLGHAYYPFNVMAQSLLFNWVLGLDNRAPLFWAADAPDVVGAVRWICIGLALLLAVSGALSIGRRRAWVALLWLIVPFLLVALVSLRVPVFQPRYLLWSAPALYVLMAAGIAVLGRWGRAALAGVAVIQLLGSLAHMANPIRPDLRAAFAALTPALRAGDAIVYQIPYTRYSHDYYGPRPPGVEVIDGPYTNGGLDEAGVDAELQALRAFPRVWLVEIETEMWDERGLTRAWFDANLRATDSRAYHGIRVTRYEP